MDWTGDAYILSVKKHGETSAIIEVFNRERGRHLGLVRGGVSRKHRPVLQIGNHVSLEWRARLADHLGYFTVEAHRAYAAELMEDRLSLAGLTAACAVAREALPEREPYPRLYDAFEVLIAHLHDPELWPALYVCWEAGLLSAMGYGLDLTACAATGTTQNLTHISPRSGRAVSAAAAQPYLDKLFALPPFLRASLSAGGTGMREEGAPPSTAPTAADIENGLKLTGYFLETRLQWSVGRTLPEARARMIGRLMEYIKMDNAPLQAR